LARVTVQLPSQLEREAGGERRFELDAATPRDALAALPVSDLLFDERGTLRPLVHVFVDGADARDALDDPLADGATVRIVAAIAGG
jgi:molybdopterin converting factor small subunit